MGQPKLCSIAYSGASVAAMFLGIDNSGGAITARSRVYEFSIGPGAVAPVDQGGRFDIVRATAAPTSGATPVIGYNDISDGAALATPFQAATGGALSNTAPLYSIGLHQKASFRWVASPGREFVNPITTLYGIGIYSPTAYKSADYTVAAGFYWEE